MALQKEIATKYGYNPNYILVQDPSVQKNGENHLSWTLLVYKDQATRELDIKNFITAWRFEYEVTDEEKLWNLFALSYAKLTESVMVENEEWEQVESNLINFSHTSSSVWLQDAISDE